MAAMEAQETEHEVRVSEPTGCDNRAHQRTVPATCVDARPSAEKGQAFGPVPCDFFEAVGLNPFTLPHIWSSGRRAARRGHDASGSSLI
jgi:hypothetical protein